MKFSDFASLCYELEKTPSRLAKITSAAAYLKRLQPDEIRYGVAFLSGRPFPISDPRTLDIGPSTLFEAAKIPETGNLSSTPLALKDIADGFGRIAESSGKGSRLGKYGMLKELIERAHSHERPILLRLLHNNIGGPLSVTGHHPCEHQPVQPVEHQRQRDLHRGDHRRPW